MSILKAGAVQVGQSSSASNNFHWRNLLDGLLRLSRGNAGAPITDVMRVKADNSVEFPGGYTGSAADEKRRCTAWVNFNGTGTVAIRDSYNVSSITDNGTGQYTVNFATPLNNGNFAAVANYNSTGTESGGGSNDGQASCHSYTVNGFTIITPAGDSIKVDKALITAVVFGGN